MTSPILLTGGTGTLGSLVLPRLREAGHHVRVLSRRDHDPRDGVEYVAGDLASGDGVDVAVKGIDTILHCAGSPKGDDAKAQTLARAASAAGVRHLVSISVVGADRVPVVSRVDRAMFGYFAAKRAAEQIVAESGVPWSTLRATQVHDLILSMVQPMARMPVVPVFAGFRFQPVDAGEVADRLVELALGEPAGLVPDIAGPRVYRMKDLVRGYLRAAGKHRLTLPVRVPGKAAGAYRDGANLALDRGVGRRTWEEFLSERIGEIRPWPVVEMVEFSLP
jgi:uncharacterized protein YbjT (DUF2867 family)